MFRRQRYEISVCSAYYITSRSIIKNATPGRSSPAPSMGEGEFYELEGEKNRLAVSRSYNRIMQFPSQCIRLYRRGWEVENPTLEQIKFSKKGLFLIFFFRNGKEKKKKQTSQRSRVQTPAAKLINTTSQAAPGSVKTFYVQFH